MSNFLLQGQLKALPNKQEELAKILLRAAKLMKKAPGCKLYVVSTSTFEKDTIFITEIWDSKEDHENSLKINGVKELISEAFPLLDGQPTRGMELDILGGHGV